MIILFRESDETLEEFDVARKSKFEVYNRILKLPENQKIIGRYSVLPFYKELEQELKIINSSLINSYSQHRYVADIENWYADLKDVTPTTWFSWSLKSLPYNKQFVVKGRTNSRKFQWNRQMFCDSADKLIKISNSLMDDVLIRDQGICVREYVPLKQYDVGINGLPVTNEWRIFCYKDRVVAGGYYWSNYLEHKPYEFSGLPKEALALISKVAATVSKNINFYVIDIAETKAGEWIVIELNDGQMSGLSDISAKELYDNLYERTK